MEIQTEEVKKTKAKPKICPLKHSNFFLTINTQKDVSKLNENEYKELLEKFKTVMDEFYNVELKNFVIMSGSKVGEGYGMPKNAPREELEKRVEKATCEYVIEVGPNSHKLHSHGMLCFTKRGLDTKMDYDKIRNWLEEKMGFTCHFKNELFRDAKKNLQEYIKKAPVD